MGGARVGRRAQVLTRGRAPQEGRTPLYIAVEKSHLAVVKVLVAKGADTNAAEKVRERRGGDVGR